MPCIHMPSEPLLLLPAAATAAATTPLLSPHCPRRRCCCPLCRSGCRRCPPPSRCCLAAAACGVSACRKAPPLGPPRPQTPPLHMQLLAASAEVLSAASCCLAKLCGNLDGCCQFRFQALLTSCEQTPLIAATLVGCMHAPHLPPFGEQRYPLPAWHSAFSTPAQTAVLIVNIPRSIS